MHFATPTSAQSDIELVHKSAYNKTKYSKINKTKLKDNPSCINSLKSVGEILINPRF